MTIRELEQFVDNELLPHMENLIKKAKSRMKRHKLILKSNPYTGTVKFVVEPEGFGSEWFDEAIKDKAFGKSNFITKFGDRFPELVEVYRISNLFRGLLHRLSD